MLRLLPMWDYLCPKCRSKVKQKSHKCPYCGENYDIPLRVPPKVLKEKKALSDYVHKHIFPKVSQAHRDYLTQFFTEIFSDGFESGDFSAWTGTANSSGETCSVESVDPHHDTKNAKFQTDGSGYNEYAYCYKDITGQTIIYVRCYFKETTIFPSFWGGYHNIISVRNQSNGEIAHVGIYVPATTPYWYLGYLDGDTFKTGSNGAWWTGASPSISTYYCVELYAKIDGATGEYKVYIDGTERISVTGLDTDNRGIVDRVRVGVPSATGMRAHAHRVDCVVVADAYIGTEEGPVLKEVTDTVGLAGSILVNKTLSFEDTIGLEDAVLGNKSPLIVADAFSLSELINAITEATLKTVTDQVSLSDGAKVLKQLSVSDAVTLVDGVNVTERTLRVLDAVALADTLHVNKFLQVTETISLAEVVQVGVEGVKKTKLFLILGDLAVQLTGD